ncbi:acetolactate synthase small subunit, partial [Gammaproteobacteria bacterium]|nr:acetolactate synthase small subunit [Gammaproteobacteria bacterium]
MRHTIAILLQNESGALSRVASMFSTRGYNIDSLSVAPTQDPMVSRLTLVTEGSDEVIEQITKQLYKLIDVVDVFDITLHDHIEREMMLIKIEPSTESTEELNEIISNYSATIINEKNQLMIIEVMADSDVNNNFLTDITNLSKVIAI